MSSETRTVKCEGCGRDLTEEVKIDPEMSCQECGSRKREFFVSFGESIGLSAATSVKVKDPSGFITQEERSRSSKSKQTGRPVKITVNVDRRDPEKTKVTHNVKELDKHGIFYKKIHEDVKEGPAKHRPKKDK